MFVFAFLIAFIKIAASQHLVYNNSNFMEYYLINIYENTYNIRKQDNILYTQKNIGESSIYIHLIYENYTYRFSNDKILINGNFNFTRFEISNNILKCYGYDVYINNENFECNGNILSFIDIKKNLKIPDKIYNVKYSIDTIKYKIKQLNVYQFEFVDIILYILFISILIFTILVCILFIEVYIYPYLKSLLCVNKYSDSVIDKLYDKITTDHNELGMIYIQNSNNVCDENTLYQNINEINENASEAEYIEMTANNNLLSNSNTNLNELQN
jgi:hypothetical protein